VFSASNSLITDLGVYEMKTIGLIILISFFLIFSVNSSFSTEGATYLKMGVGARFLAMGSAATASVDDATATYWNVAGLTRVGSVSIASMYSYADDILHSRHNFLALASSVKGIGSFGIGWVNAGFVDIPRYNAQNVEEGSFNIPEDAFMFSYGTMFETVRLGAGIKILRQKFDPYNEATMGFGGFDIGTISDSKSFSVGLSVQNILGKIADTPVPIISRIGTTGRFLPEGNLMIAAGDTFVYQIGAHTGVHTLNLGAEYWIAKLIALRVGLTNDITSRSMINFSAGIGINISNIFGILFNQPIPLNIGFDLGYSKDRDSIFKPERYYLSINVSR